MKPSENEEQAERQEVVLLLRTLADSLERNEGCELSVGSLRVRVPADPEIDIEYEGEGGDEELEIEIKWRRPSDPGAIGLKRRLRIGLAAAAGAIAGGAALLQYVHSRSRAEDGGSDSPES